MKVVYVCELWPGRALTSISRNTIYFNITGHMEFDSRQEASAFLERWKNHFFGVQSLTIARIERRE